MKNTRSQVGRANKVSRRKKKVIAAKKRVAKDKVREKEQPPVQEQETPESTPVAETQIEEVFNLEPDAQGDQDEALDDAGPDPGDTTE